MKKDRLYRLEDGDTYDRYYARCFIGKLEKHADDKINGEIWMVKILGSQSYNKNGRFFSVGKWEDFVIEVTDKYLYIDGRNWQELKDKECADIIKDLDSSIESCQRDIERLKEYKKLIPSPKKGKDNE